MSFLSSLISPVTSIADKMVMDKDKYADLQFKKLELKAKARSELLKITTTPNVDAFIKIVMAFNDVILPLLRPLGGALMTAFGAYCLYKGIDINELTQGALVGAFPAWMVDRGIDKHRKGKLRSKEIEYEEWDE